MIMVLILLAPQDEIRSLKHQKSCQPPKHNSSAKCKKTKIPTAQQSTLPLGHLCQPLHGLTGRSGLETIAWPASAATPLLVWSLNTAVVLDINVLVNSFHHMSLQSGFKTQLFSKILRSQWRSTKLKHSSSRNRWFLLSALLNQHMMMFRTGGAQSRQKHNHGWKTSFAPWPTRQPQPSS